MTMETYRKWGGRPITFLHWWRAAFHGCDCAEARYQFDDVLSTIWLDFLLRMEQPHT